MGDKLAFNISQVSNLPDGWCWGILDQLMKKIVDGTHHTPTYVEHGVPFLSVKDIRDGQIYFDSCKYISQEEHKKLCQRCYPEYGDLLITKSGTIGRCAIVKAKCEFSLFVSVALLKPASSEINISFISLAFQAWFQTINVQNDITGSAIKNFHLVDFKQLALPLPPLNEQRRIVAKIEELKERTQRAKEALEAIPALLKQFRQSVLAAAFRGDLTADWREENPDVEPASVLLERTSHSLNLNFHKETNNINRDQQIIPNTWSWTPLKLVVKNIQAGKNFSCPEIPVTEDKVGLVKISAVTWGFFDEKETKTVTDKSKIEPSLFINEGDFLISRANTLELVGASVVVEEIRHKIMISDKVWRVTFLEAENNYINFYLKSKLGRKEIESRATGNQLSMRNISQNAFKDVVIAIPPLIEQKEIIYRVKYFYKIADAIEYQYQEIKANLGLLDQSILGKAFRGELVPQDPNDEPASVLLERIRAEYAKLKTKTDKKSTAKTSTRRTKNTQLQEEEPVQLELGLES
ncbi:restriction endonuclease subunit S (plasmid) [Nostoc sp. UHCC 0302]|uniref:restriction endonuclease subunit S n=1 Tax=Nostoc sp. UHCC 0302 TaxID=3134896 RepID=UPI00311CA670